MYDENSQKKVTLVVHSMGGPVSHYFLTRFSKVDQVWKDKYIHAYITLAGGWSGGNSALQALISGPSHLLPNILGIINPNPFLDKRLAPVIHSLESVYWMMPRASVWGDMTLVSTPSKSYTAKDYQQMFEDLGLKNSYGKYSGVIAMSPDFPPPNVNTHCFYGVGLDTVKVVKYDKDFSGTPPTSDHPNILHGDGDDTVNIESSEICLGWIAQRGKYPFEYKKFNDVSHVGIVSDEAVLTDIANIAIRTE